MSGPRGRAALAAGVLAAGGLAFWAGSRGDDTAGWAPGRHRLFLEVDPKRGGRSNSVASVEVDFAAELAARGVSGTLDEHSIAVVAYDEAGRPRVHDPGRTGDESIHLPWRLERAYPLTRVRLSFVLPDERVRRLAVHFDTEDEGGPRPPRYPGIVGDGDLFTEGWGRREIAANAHDTFTDLDGDGDLDLVKGGTEPFAYVYENRGQGRFVDRGRLTSGGEVLAFPADDANRSWVSVEMADWDGDGRLDVLTAVDGVAVFHRGVGESRAVADMALAGGVYLRANGVPIQLDFPRLEAADIDADGDLDLVAGTEEGRVFLFRNVGSRSLPVLSGGRLLAYFAYMDAKAGVKVADFDGDGRLDFVVGRYWQRSPRAEPRLFGRFYRNVGTPAVPRFAVGDVSSGAPHTERFQPADALRQNGVRAVDWDEDGRMDLLAGDTDGFVWLFRNTAGARAPVFAPSRLLADGKPLRVHGEEPEARAAGYARVDVTDWNEDGRKDLLVADGRGWLWLHLNRGGDRSPVLGPGRRVSANGKPIDGTSRGSVLVTDWNRDGRKDVIFGMVGEGPSESYDWPPRSGDRRSHRGLLYYRNFGTDAAPELGAPKWIKAGPEAAEIDLLRPNLGDFVDWDGDGRRDLIACEFELDCRLFRNTTSGAPGVRPRFDSSAQGVVILKPWTGQMISGADAVDWNGDGDLDLITGQGHGGSGLRFYERDYLEDVRRGTLPVVTIDRRPDPTE